MPRWRWDLTRDPCRARWSGSAYDAQMHAVVALEDRQHSRPPTRRAGRPRRRARTAPEVIQRQGASQAARQQDRAVRAAHGSKGLPAGRGDGRRVPASRWREERGRAEGCRRRQATAATAGLADTPPNAPTFCRRVHAATAPPSAGRVPVRPTGNTPSRCGCRAMICGALQVPSVDRRDQAQVGFPGDGQEEQPAASRTADRSPARRPRTV